MESTYNSSVNFTNLIIDEVTTIDWLDITHLIQKTNGKIILAGDEF